MSDLGRVRSIRILKPSTRKKGGYVALSIRQNGCSSSTKVVHRLVAEAFIPNPEGKPDVAHRNGIRTQNDVENLRWSTELENSFDRVAHGTHGFKLTLDQASEIKRLHFNGELSRKQIAEKFGVSLTMVTLIINGKRWKVAT